MDGEVILRKKKVPDNNQQKNAWLGRPGFVSCSHPEQLVDELDLLPRHCQRKTGLSWGEASCNCLRMKNPFGYFKTSPGIIRLAVVRHCQVN